MLHEPVARVAVRVRSEASKIRAALSGLITGDCRDSWRGICRRLGSASSGGAVTTRVEKSIEVDVPLRTAYGQGTQFETFPEFMGGVKRVQQRSDSTLHWVAEIVGVEREWDAAILEQIPDQKIAWAAKRRGRLLPADR
jgi:Polyketide cyclase / dehydrase and lipid transport